MSTELCDRVALDDGPVLPWKAWRRRLGQGIELLREARLRRWRAQALAGLSEATLRDIGLHDAAPPRVPKVRLDEWAQFW